MKREHDAAAAAAASNGRDELGSCLDVDELGASVLCLRQQALPFFLGTPEAATLPLRPAGDEDGAPASFNRSERIRAVDEVETNFDEVGKRRGITRAAQLLHRPSGYRCTQLRITHVLKTKKASSAVLRRLSRIPILRCRLADRPLSARIPPPIGRKRPAEATRLTRKRQRQNVGDNNRGLQGVSIVVWAHIPFLLDR